MREQAWRARVSKTVGGGIENHSWEPFAADGGRVVGASARNRNDVFNCSTGAVQKSHCTRRRALKGSGSCFTVKLLTISSGQLESNFEFRGRTPYRAWC